MPLPPLEELPILPDMSASMDLDLAIDDNGEVYVFHTKPFPEPIGWAEYNAATSRLSFVSEEGRIQESGLEVYPHMGEKVLQASRLFAIYVENGQVKHIIEAALIHNS